MTEYETIRSAIVGNFKFLKEKADKAAVIKYGTKCSGIGFLFPNIYKKICKSNYGRIIKNIEELDKYVIYEFDENNTPLRIRKIKNGVCTESIYWFHDSDTLAAACFIGDTDQFMVGATIFKFVLEKTRLLEFSLIDSGRKIEYIFNYCNYPHIKLTEKYTYHSDGNNPNNKKYEYVYDELDNGKVCNIKDCC